MTPIPIRRVPKIRVLHRRPGRLRLRLRWLRENEDAASALAETLGRMEGMIRVTVRPFTGSVLCEYDPEQADRKAILETVKRETGVPRHVHGDEPDPDEVAGYARIAANEGALLARTLARGFRELNVDLMRVTGGRMDLGFAITLAFFTAGLAQLVRTRRVPVPPWFNLAWWAFRTFTEVEKSAIARCTDTVLPTAQPYTGPDRRRLSPDLTH